MTAAQATSASPETNQEDPSGNVNFNSKNLQAYSGDYWGVMALTLNPNGYTWNFESALAGSYSPFCRQWSYSSCTDCEWRL